MPRPARNCKYVYVLYKGRMKKLCDQGLKFEWPKENWVGSSMYTYDGRDGMMIWFSDNTEDLEGHRMHRCPAPRSPWSYFLLRSGVHTDKQSTAQQKLHHLPSHKRMRAPDFSVQSAHLFFRVINMKVCRSRWGTPFSGSAAVIAAPLDVGGIRHAPSAAPLPGCGAVRSFQTLTEKQKTIGKEARSPKQVRHRHAQRSNANCSHAPWSRDTYDQDQPSTSTCPSPRIAD
ncbi:hypothetical protein VTK26DRAFT_4657 [Humicola hyalothermophila]